MQLNLFPYLHHGWFTLIRSGPVQITIQHTGSIHHWFSIQIFTLSLSDTPSVKLMVNSSTLGTFSLFFSVWYSVRVFTTTWRRKEALKRVKSTGTLQAMKAGGNGAVCYKHTSHDQIIALKRVRFTAINSQFAYPLRWLTVIETYSLLIAFVSIFVHCLK